MWPQLLQALTQPLPELYRQDQERLTRENPALYWYPCCGSDLSPLIFDRYEMDGLRIFPLRGSDGSLVLWLNDRLEELPSLHEALMGVADVACAKTFDATAERYQAQWCVVPGSRFTTAITVQPERPGDPCTLPLELFRVCITTPRAVGHGWRPAEGDTYTVFYSNVDSVLLTRLVFRPFNLAVRVGAIIHPGWFEPPNGPTNHYTLVPEMVLESQCATGKTAFVLTDGRRELGCKECFSDTRTSVDSWTGVEVKMLKGRHAGMTVTPDVFNQLLPLVGAWAEAQERVILRDGVPLSPGQLADAAAAGVAHPERVRLLKVEQIPMPEHPALRAAAETLQLMWREAGALSLRYGIFIHAGGWENRPMVVHELAHTAQYERLGGIRPFLAHYLQECLQCGYAGAPTERKAREVAANICH